MASTFKMELLGEAGCISYTRQISHLSEPFHGAVRPYYHKMKRPKGAEKL